jgi:hypothetical protein
MTPAPVISAGAEISVPARRKKNRGEHGEGDGPQPVHQHPVVQEHPGHHQPGHVSGQDGLAARLGGQPAEPEQDDQQQLDFRFGDPVAEGPDRQAEQPGQHQQGDRADRGEDDQQPAVAGEQAAEREHGAQVGDEACGQDELAQVLAIQAGLDHDRVHHRDRGGAQRDPADLGGVQMPAQDKLAEPEGGQERQREREEADGQAGLPVPAQGHRIDLRSGQEGEHQGSHAGQEHHDIGRGNVLADTGNVAGQRADHDLDQRGGHRELDADH